VIVRDNPYLTSLSFLPSVVSIGHLYLEDNPNLVDARLGASAVFTSPEKNYIDGCPRLCPQRRPFIDVPFDQDNCAELELHFYFSVSPSLDTESNGLLASIIAKSVAHVNPLVSDPVGAVSFNHRLQWQGNVTIPSQVDELLSVTVHNVSSGSRITSGMQGFLLEQNAFETLSLSDAEASFVKQHALTQTHVPVLLAGEDGYRELPFIKSCLFVLFLDFASRCLQVRLVWVVSSWLSIKSSPLKRRLISSSAR
jgi:hypothetical protein